MSSPIKSAPIANSTQVSKGSPLVVIDLDDIGDGIKSTRAIKQSNVISEAQKASPKLYNETSITSSIVESQNKNANTIYKSDGTSRISNSQHQVTRNKNHHSQNVPLRIPSRVSNPQPATQVLEDKEDSSSDELGLFNERPAKDKSLCSLTSIVSSPKLTL